VYKLGGQDLNGHIAVDRGLVGFIDRGHSPHTDFFDNFVLSDGFSDEVCHKFAPWEWINLHSAIGIVGRLVLSPFCIRISSAEGLGDRKVGKLFSERIVA
jgi:hypothetical protein